MVNPCANTEKVYNGKGDHVDDTAVRQGFRPRQGQRKGPKRRANLRGVTSGVTRFNGIRRPNRIIVILQLFESLSRHHFIKNCFGAIWYRVAVVVEPPT
jgi:hypothetical protein